MKIILTFLIITNIYLQTPYNIILQSNNFKTEKNRKLENKEEVSFIIEDPENFTAKMFKKKPKNELKEVKKNQKIVCDHRIIRSFIKREKLIKNPIQFNKPNKLCPKIEDSCCTNKEIRALYVKYNSNLDKLRDLFHHLFDTFKTFADDYDALRTLLLEVDEEDEKCAEITAEEALMLLKVHKNSYKRKKKALSQYYNFVIDYQSGFICSMCDNNFNRYFENHDGILKMIFRDLSCNNVYKAKILISNAQFFTINLAKIVKVLHCSIEKSSGPFQYLQLKNLKKKISDYKWCLSTFDQKNTFTSERCRVLCKNSFHLNYIGNIHNIFQLSNKMKYFYSNSILKKKNSFYRSEKLNKRIDVLLLKPVAGKTQTYNFEDTILRISQTEGLSFTNNKMNMPDKVELFAYIGIKMVVLGLISFLNLF